MTSPFIIVPLAVLLAPVLGALLMGLDRKVTARIQGRMGPPIFQPFYDVIKLLLKEPVAVNRVQIGYAYLHLAFMVMVIVLLVLGQDLLLILFAHAFSAIALILGGMSVRSPYSRIGSSRKILQLLAYEPILVLMVVGIYLIQHKSFMVSDIDIGGQPLLVSLPLVFLSFLMVMAIKLDKSPFDVATSHHAHQELIKGVTLEYAGPYLAVIEIAHFYEMAFLFSIVMMFCLPYWWLGLGVSAICFLALIVLDNSFARHHSMWMLRYMWTLPMILAVSNIIWLYYR